MSIKETQLRNVHEITSQIYEMVFRSRWIDAISLRIVILHNE